MEHTKWVTSYNQYEHKREIMAGKNRKYGRRAVQDSSHNPLPENKKTSKGF